MKRSAVAQNTLMARSSKGADTQISGAALILARVIWIALMVLGIATYLAAIPYGVAHFATACPQADCALTPQQAQALAQLGISLRTYAIATLAFDGLFLAISVVVALILFWRRSHDWMALLVGLSLVLYPIANALSAYPGMPAYLLISSFVVAILGSTLYYLMFALFPSGRLVPRGLIVLVIAWVALHAALLVNPDLSIPGWATGLIYLVLYAGIIGSQIYRYRATSTPIQRQQTKWVVFGIVIVLIANIAYWQPVAFVPALSNPSSLYAVLGLDVYQLVSVLIPLSFGIAILRYRLYDIDVLINRTLVYGTVTLLLALVYFALVYGVQRVVGNLLGANTSTLAIVASTLLIAALFNPLRRRIQATVDRRFYRRKYNAARTLARFSATLRNEVDLSDLKAHLIGVVDETMRPAHVSLWLRPVAPGTTSGGQEPPLKGGMA